MRNGSVVWSRGRNIAVATVGADKTGQFLNEPTVFPPCLQAFNLRDDPFLVLGCHIMYLSILR